MALRAQKILKSSARNLSLPIGPRHIYIKNILFFSVSHKLMDAPLTSANAQSRAWVFTLNNHSSVDVPRTIECKYCIWQEEQGEQGTKHLQGYVYFGGSKRLSTLKKILPTAHWEIRRGTHEQAKEYCSKEDSRISGPYEFGEEPVTTGQGSRSDLVSLKRSLDQGSTDQQIWEEHFPTMVKYYKGVNEYKRVKQMADARSEKTVCIVLFGGTGSGKTYTVQKNFPNAYWVSKPPKGSPLWMDGYDGRSPVAIDEFYGWLPYDLLLRMCDAYPLQLPTKGGHTGFAPKFIIFTSNKPPEQWYDYSKFSGGKDPLFRRLELIIEKRDRDSYTIWKQPNGQVSLNLPGPDIDFSLVEGIPPINL